MSQIFQRAKVELNIPIQEVEDGFVINTDRMFAGFDNAKQLESFSRNGKGFLSKLHNPTHANNAGFFFMLSSDFGSGSNQSQLAVYALAIAQQTEEGNPFVLMSQEMTEDDVADAWMLMTRKWALSEKTDSSKLNGSYEGFRDFFLANSEEA